MNKSKETIQLEKTIEKNIASMSTMSFDIVKDFHANHNKFYDYLLYLVMIHRDDVWKLLEGEEHTPLTGKKENLMINSMTIFQQYVLAEIKQIINDKQELNTYTEQVNRAKNVDEVLAVRNEIISKYDSESVISPSINDIVIGEKSTQPTSEEILKSLFTVSSAYAFKTEKRDFAEQNLGPYFKNWEIRGRYVSREMLYKIGFLIFLTDEEMDTLLALATKEKCGFYPKSLFESVYRFCLCNNNKAKKYLYSIKDVTDKTELVFKELFFSGRFAFHHSDESLARVSNISTVEVNQKLMNSISDTNDEKEFLSTLASSSYLSLDDFAQLLNKFGRAALLREIENEIGKSDLTEVGKRYLLRFESDKVTVAELKKMGFVDEASNTRIACIKQVLDKSNITEFVKKTREYTKAVQGGENDAEYSLALKLLSHTMKKDHITPDLLPTLDHMKKLLGGECEVSRNDLLLILFFSNSLNIVQKGVCIGYIDNNRFHEYKITNGDSIAPLSYNMWYKNITYNCSGNDRNCFEYEANNLLKKCGFAPLSARNLIDRLIFIACKMAEKSNSYAKDCLLNIISSKE